MVKWQKKNRIITVKKRYIPTTGPRGPRLIWYRSGVGPMGPIKPLGPGGPGGPSSPGDPGEPSGPGSPKIGL